MSPALTLPEKVVAVDRALEGVPHAFGGAISLGYYAEPRSTVDIDVNVFIPASDRDAALAPLGRLGVEFAERELTAINRDGQGRGAWEHTPVDLFFAYDDFHAAAEKGAREVPFAATHIPILAPEHLMVCKTVFNRSKDWVDIEAMLADGTSVDVAEVIRWVVRIVGGDDARYRRIVALLTR